MSLHLTTPDAQPRPQQALPAGQAIARARLHEFCGPARVTLAALMLSLCDGPVIWIQPGWLSGRLFPDGVRDLFDPARLIQCLARRPEDLLWSLEEALRSGAAPSVICQLPGPPGLTPVRRLHLAAEAGAEAARHRGRAAPIGVILTPEQGGAQGVESRWHMAPAPSGSTLTEAPRAAWRMTRLRARMAPPAAWGLIRVGGSITATPAPVTPAPVTAT